MLDRRFFADYRVLPSPFWERTFGDLWAGMQRASGTTVHFENVEALPGAPVLLATNSTQKYDFMPFREELLRRRIPAVTVTKGKNYHSKVMGFLLGRLGVVPIASRGYILLVDFLRTVKRRPSEDEYRALRRYLDQGAPLPEGDAFQRLESTPRVILGHTFDPSREPYRATLRRVYASVMAETVRLSREAAQAGHHVQMYPEGTVSGRLGQGRIGAVQLAWTLKLPIVPVGLNGMRAAFRGQGLRLRGGPIRAVFGQPYTLPADFLPKDFVPFDPEHEERHRGTLQAATDALMERLDGLLDADCRRQAGFETDGTQGTRRFL